MKQYGVVFLLIISLNCISQDSYEYSKLLNTPKKSKVSIKYGKQFNSIHETYLSYSFMAGVNNSPSLIGCRFGNMSYKGGWWLNVVINNFSGGAGYDKNKAVYTEQWIGVSDVSFNKRYFINPILSGYYGVGYGWRNFYYTISKPKEDYLKDSDQSTKGISIEVGAMLTIKDFVITSGVNILQANPRYFNFSFGFGLAF